MVGVLDFQPGYPLPNNFGTRFMADMFREQPCVRLAIAVLICIIVCSLFFVRLLFGVGPMHDHQGNQAPLFDYIVGAVTGTVLAVAWIVARGWTTRNK